MSTGDPITRLNAALEGRYRVERKLREVGTATLYRADDLRHERQVVLKVVRSPPADASGGGPPTATEAELHRPLLLPLLDSGRTGDLVYYVTPFTEGDVPAVVADGPGSRRALRVALSVAILPALGLLWLVLRDPTARSMAAGFIYVLLGADLVVRGGVSLAMRMRMPPAVVGLTIVSLASTAPELVVVAGAASGGHSDLALGNVVGCNVANLFLIVGLPTLISRMDCSDSQSRVMGWVLLMSSMVFVAMCVAGPLGRPQGIVLVGGAALMLAVALTVKLRKRTDRQAEPPLDPWPLGLPERFATMALFIVLGAVALLPMGADLMVDGAVELAQELRVPEAVIAATVVSLGTSLPELATAVVAAVQKRSEMAVGNILGSSTLNLLLVMGVGAIAAPTGIEVPSSFIREQVSLMVVGAGILAVYTSTGSQMGRRMGAVLVLTYAGYILRQLLIS